MSNVTDNPKTTAPNSTADGGRGNMLQVVVIAIIALAAAGLLAYQYLGCSSCYMPI